MNEPADRERRGEKRTDRASPIRKSTAYTRREVGLRRRRAGETSEWGGGCCSVRSCGDVDRNETGAHLDRITRRGEDSLVVAKNKGRK
jgi:hypothetical protein